MLKRLNFKINKRAFTLIETIVAIFVMMVGVVGALAVIQQTVSYTALSSSRLTASYLAQEGIEIVRSVRDGNWLEGDFWSEGLADCSGGCVADYKHSYGPDQQDPVLPVASNQFLNIDNDGFYSYSPGSPAKFKRKITITSAIDSDSLPYLEVYVLVEWQQLGKDQQIAVREYLYDWR